jgi:tRNA pseudouridine55 synthase
VLVDKPAGLTSHDVVQRARRALRTRAVGHTGTLDPFATGLLVLLVGRATRLARFVEAERKTYLATARLGLATETDDLTGTPIGAAVDTSRLTPDDVRTALLGFLGPLRQRPPRFSAKHVAGERSYRLARRGVHLDLPESEVTVEAIEFLGLEAGKATFRARVSAGTYIRALARDLGERLGVGAHLTALRREAIGALRVEDAVRLDQLSPAAVVSARRALGHLPTVELDQAARTAVRHGRPLPGASGAEGDIALVQGDELVAVARAGDGWLRPSVVLESPA